MKRQGPGWSKFAQRVCRPLGMASVLRGGAAHPPAVVEVCEAARCVLFDRRIDSAALGVTGSNDNIEYLGATVWMRPSEFQRLVPPRTDPVEHIRAHVAKKLPVGNPMLYLDVDKAHGVARVTGHEGRGRMLVTGETVGDQPVPVHVIVREVIPGERWDVGSYRPAWSTQEARARHWDGVVVAALDCVVPETRERILPKPVRGCQLLPRVAANGRDAEEVVGTNGLDLTP